MTYECFICKLLLLFASRIKVRQNNNHSSTLYFDLALLLRFGAVLILSSAPKFKTLSS